MRIRTSAFIAVASISMVLSGAARGGSALDTVNWVPSVSGNGQGTGTLANGTITVNYFSVAAGNSGNTIPDNFATSPATASAVPNGLTHATAGVVGATTTAPELEQIYFSSTVTNPTLLVNFTDTTAKWVFQGMTITLLSSNNAQVTAGVLVNFAGSSKSSNDGFAAIVNGTFGPATPISFFETTTAPGGFDSQAFTIGIASVPEPASIVSGSLATLMVLGYAWRRRKAITA